MPHSTENNVISLTDPEISIETVGRKAINLSQMINDGFRVPPCIRHHRARIRSFIRDTALRDRISSELEGIDFDDETSLANGTESIRSMIVSECMPSSIGDLTFKWSSSGTWSLTYRDVVVDMKAAQPVPIPAAMDIEWKPQNLEMDYKSA